MTESSATKPVLEAGAETPRRSLVKAISWRIVGTLDTLILSYVLITYLGPIFGLNIEESGTTAVKAASLIAVTEVITKLIIYYLHERIWARMKWGVRLIDGVRSVTMRRSGTKTATWRVLASLDTTLLAWFFTGNLATAFSIGGLEVITKLILYFFHERVWQRIQFGIVK